MKRFIIENINIFKNAIGKEPIGQIFKNAIKKLVVIFESTENREITRDLVNNKPSHETKYKSSLKKYKEYLNRRNLYFKNIGLVAGAGNIRLGLVWILPSADQELIKTMWETIKNQSVSFDSFHIVSSNKNTHIRQSHVKYFQTLNKACQESKDQYIFVLRDAVQLHKDYVQQSKNFIAENLNAGLFYACDDEINKNDELCNPIFKPQFNFYLLYNINYIGCNIIVKKKVGTNLCWFNADFSDAFVYDFLLRVSENKISIKRIDEVLIHKYFFNKKEGILERKRSLREYLLRNKDTSIVLDGIEDGSTRLKRRCKNHSMVSIIIPFRDKVDLLKNCVDSILAKTNYENFEILLANNGSTELKTKLYLRQLVKSHNSVSVINIDIPFNYSRINNLAVDSCKGDYLLFLNNDTKVISNEWLETMVSELEKDDVGIVGAKLLYADDTIQHAGVIFGIGHVAGHAFRYLDDLEGGQLDRANSVQEYLAVTGACLLTKKKLFFEVGKFDDINLSISNNDVDFCLKVRSLGYKIIYTPYAKLYHLESKSRAHDMSYNEKNRYEKEVNYMKNKWSKFYKVDPFFHPHLDKRKEDFSIDSKMVN